MLKTMLLASAAGFVLAAALVQTGRAQATMTTTTATGTTTTGTMTTTTAGTGRTGTTTTATTSTGTTSTGTTTTATAPATSTLGNATCPGEEVFFNPGTGQDIFVPPGYKISPVAIGLDFPTNIAFHDVGGGNFEIFVTQAGDSLPGRCNSEDSFPAVSGADNPFLASLRVLDQSGRTLRVLGKAASVQNKADAGVLHAPTIGVTFETGTSGRLFVSDSRQGIRGAQGPRNSSRIIEVDPQSGTVTERITGLPTGDHPTEQILVQDGFLYWSQGSATNSGVVGHDNGAAVGGGVDLEHQHEIPCQDVILSGNNFDSGDGHLSGGFLPHGQPSSEGQIVKAFDGATQPGMCTGAILRARLDNLQGTIEPFSWGYRNPFGIRFAPQDHPLNGALFISENGEDERGARPVNNAPDRLQVSRGGLDWHGWPDRFGGLASTQRVFNPIGGPGDDNPAVADGNHPVLPVLLVSPQEPVDPLANEPAGVAAVGHDFAPAAFAGGGNPGDGVRAGDSLVTREGDFGFSPSNGLPEEGHDVELVRFFDDGRITRLRFAFNCKAADQVDGPVPGTRFCRNPAEQAFSEQIHGINRPVDGKFGPDGAFYVVDFGAVRDFGGSDAAAKFKVDGDGPLVQIPATGVIWKIEKSANTATASANPGGSSTGTSSGGTTVAGVAPGGGQPATNTEVTDVPPPAGGATSGPPSTSTSTQGGGGTTGTTGAIATRPGL